ncbi:MAG TPA: phospholipase D-like domain-containing protein [Chryseosolibacter sp.]
MNFSTATRKNKVELIRGGKGYFARLVELINGAERSIHFQTYIYDEDETGTEVTAALIAAAERGVKIFLLLDRYGSQGISKEWVKKVNAAGIFFRFFRPLFKSKRFYLGRRLHHKVVVIDGCRSTVAGLNISNRYNDTAEGPAWLDWALYIEGEASEKLEDICKSRLRVRYAKQVPKRIASDFKGATPVRISVNDWVRRKRQIYRSYLEMFRDSEKDIIIMSAYFLPGRRFRKAISAAIKRGVKIKVVLTGNADVFLIKYAERYIYRWLFRNNIEVYEYTKNVLHGKISVADRKFVTVGSFNLNNLSAFASVELNADVLDENFANGVHDRLQEIIDTECVRITEKKFNRQFNLVARTAHHAAYYLFRFLFFISTKQGDA